MAWSVADGRRGRRWRWTVTDADGLRHVGLVELDPGRRFVRLELATGEGMLTLHPEPDGRSIHGNVVTRDGVRALAFDWGPDTHVAIVGDSFGSAILGGGGVGERSSSGLVVRRRLGVTPGAAAASLRLDERGVPLLSEPREWPLEE